MHVYRGWSASMGVGQGWKWTRKEMQKEGCERNAERKDVTVTPSGSRRNTRGSSEKDSFGIGRWKRRRKEMGRHTGLPDI